MNTAHLYFDLVIEREYLTKWKDEKLPSLHIQYTLDRSGNVVVTGWTAESDILKHITVTQELKDQMLAAAKNNSEGHKWPRKRHGRRMRPEGLNPYEDIHDQWRMEARGY